MTSHDIRSAYIRFFTSSPRNHITIPSAPLVPENDPTTLFTSSGMQPLVPYLLGQPHPLGTRLVNSQKALRVQDIEEVGDNRHTTFFEMLGNWSFGDYFKEDQLSYFYEFLTKELKLPKEKLAVTIFEGNKDVPPDEESEKIWLSLGIPRERIFRYGVEKNWWSRSGIPSAMPASEPGGPDSEVFFEFTTVTHNPQFGTVCHPNCDCGRFLEIGNSVFMQYQKQSDGSLKELPKKNVDFGGGLERLAAVLNNNPDVFQTEFFSKIITSIEKCTAKQYSDHQQEMRIIADHLKAATFLVADGVMPSNKKQGYILRRLIRRAGVKLYQLQRITNEADAEYVCDTVIDTYRNTDYFSEKNRQFIKKEVGAEMFKFSQTLERGLKQLEQTKVVNGKVAFDLYQSYGFPIEITNEILTQKGIQMNEEEFKKEFEKHQELSRTASKGMFKGGLADQTAETTKLHTANHLLQQALRDVLGTHVRQKGSNITAQRLRFDFSHGEKMTPEQLVHVETIVNQKIKDNLPVSKHVIALSDALKKGALTVPNATYPEKVTVYAIGNFSREVCGGPHVDFTGVLGSFKIIKEEAAGNQVRRIYAILT